MKKSLIPFAATLVALSSITQAQAGTICVSGYICDDRPQPPEAIQLPPGSRVSIEPSPLVLLPFQDSTGWNYGFAAPTQTISVVMPYFSDSGISAISGPDGWTYTIGTLNADGNGTAIWQPISVPSSRGGIFSFKSNLAPSEAAYQFTFDDGSIHNYQLFIPYSPLAQASGYTSFAAAVPEPSAIYMAAFGFLACIAATRHRKMAN